VKAVGKARHRPVWLPIPRFVPRLLLGRDLADTLLFDSQAVYPRRLESDGFGFAHPRVEEALSAVLRH
jgi:NAD dependent epimerase/dehydratase family enzyme